MTTKTTPIEDCPSFSGCTAPLCPLGENLAYAIFYPDEPICTSRKFRQPWVRTQRRIARRTKCNVDLGYFTAEMLGSITAVTSAIKGINPEFNASVDVWVGQRGKVKNQYKLKDVRTPMKKNREAERQGKPRTKRGMVLAHS